MEAAADVGRVRRLSTGGAELVAVSEVSILLKVLTLFLKFLSFLLV